MTSFCALLSGITVTQVSGSDRFFTVNVVGLTPSRDYSIETFPPISPVNVSNQPNTIQNGLNTYSFTKSATDAATTIKLNIKLVSSGATLSSYTLVWSQFKGFSTSKLASISNGRLDITDMVVNFTNMITQPITFEISSVFNEIDRINNSGGAQQNIVTTIDSGSFNQTPPSETCQLTFNTTITNSQGAISGYNYLLMGRTQINGEDVIILAEPFVFTTTFNYDQCTLIDRLFATSFAATSSTLIIDGGLVSDGSMPIAQTP
jgi:hypothetical protein